MVRRPCHNGESVWGVEATISRVLLETAQTWPLLLFAFGVLMGHLFLPQTPKKE